MTLITSKLYFTADLHLGHKHIIGATGRPFYNVESMNETLIANINSIVQKNDQLYILGDLCYQISQAKAYDLISRIRCKKILIRGNHDSIYQPLLFDAVYDFWELEQLKLPISLIHNPVLFWPKSNYKGIQLHGHTHNKMTYNLSNRDKGIRLYDVGVDAHHFKPVSIDEIYTFFGVI